MNNTLLVHDEKPMHDNARFMAATTTASIMPISLETITTIEAAGRFAVVHTVEGCFIVRRTLAMLQKALPVRGFVPLNKSLILNTSQIEELQVLGAGGNHLLMKDGRIVALTLQLSEMESLLHHATN